MTETMRTVQVGEAQVLVINVGELQFKFEDWYHVSESERDQHAPLFSQATRAPIQCIYIALPGTSVLVDAAAYDIAPNSTYAIPDYQPPPGLLEQLATAGVRADEIKHVVITHGHFDHYMGVTIERNGKYEPCFPNARHYIGRADWEEAWRQKALQDANSEESRTFGVLYQYGILDLITGNRALGNGGQIIAAPGETSGHQIVRIHSEGQTLYCLGDLYHHPIEVEQPTWIVHWAAVETSRASRYALTEAALRENARLIATHIPTTGRLERAATGVRWVDV